MSEVKLKWPGTEVWRIKTHSGYDAFAVVRLDMNGVLHIVEETPQGEQLGAYVSAFQMNSKLAAAQKEIAENDAEIQQLNIMLNNKEQQTKSYADEITRQFNLKIALEQKLAEKDARIKELEFQLNKEIHHHKITCQHSEANLTKAKELQTLNAALEQKVKSLEADIYIKDERYAELSGMYEATCEHEEELETKIAVLEAKLEKAVEVYCDFVGHNAFFVEAINSELAAITSETIKNEGEG